MAPPHLLTIPREIRDLFYDYLHKRADVHWKVDEGTVCCAKIEIDEAPLLNVLLTCSRLRDEYLEGRLFAKRDATICMIHEGLYYEPRSQAHFDIASTLRCKQGVQPQDRDTLVRILGPVQHLLILISDTRNDAPLGKLYTLEVIVQLNNLLGSICNSLLSARVGVIKHSDHMTFSSFRSRRKALRDDLSNRMAAPALNVAFGNLHLVQKCVASRLKLFNLSEYGTCHPGYFETYNQIGVFLFT